MNLNKFAREVTLAEGGKVSLSIAQVKEVMKIVFTKLAREYSEDEILRTIDKYNK